MSFLTDDGMVACRKPDGSASFICLKSIANLVVESLKLGDPSIVRLLLRVEPPVSNDAFWTAHVYMNPGANTYARRAH